LPELAVREFVAQPTPHMRLLAVPAASAGRFLFAPELPYFAQKIANQYDIAHVHGFFMPAVSLSMVALALRKVPYIVRTCGLLDVYSLRQKPLRKRLYWTLFDRANLARAAWIQASTARERDEIGLAGVTNHVRVIAQGVDAPAPCELPPHPYRYVLFLGRVAKKKGIAHLLRAMPKVLQSHPDVRCVIVGPDERGEQAKLAALAAELKIVHRVDFVGHAEGAEKTRWFRDAAAFVLPSDDENFGVAVVEAAIAGTPVIVSHHVALSLEVAADGAGVVVNQDAGEIADAILRVIAQPKATYSEALDKFARRFCWADAAQKLEEGYQAAIATTKP
jgi:glycosyltransferase involved in cell wall biosynthesis